MIVVADEREVELAAVKICARHLYSHLVANGIAAVQAASHEAVVFLVELVVVVQ